jgi:lipopolysaccharide export LptBFGC system permease protein LptF
MKANRTLPGSLLKRIAARVCSPDTLARLVDPLIADMQHEYAASLERGDRRAPWIQARGYATFWKALLLHAVVEAWRRALAPATRSNVPALRHSLWLGTWVTFLTFSILLLLQQASVFARAPVAPQALLLLLPSIVVVSLPTSLLFGVVVGLARWRRRSEARLERAPVWRWVAARIGFSTLTAFILTTSVVPYTNQRYRQIVVAAIAGSQAQVAKGDREMTLAELAASIATLHAEGRPRQAAEQEHEWHTRFALPAACAVFGLLALGLSLRTQRLRLPLAVGLCLALVFIYYCLLRFGDFAVQRGELPPILGAWGPNALFAAVAALLIAGHGRSMDARPGAEQQQPSVAPVP